MERRQGAHERASDFLPQTIRACLRDSSADQLHRRVLGLREVADLSLTRMSREEFLAEGELQVRVGEVAGNGLVC